MRRLLLVFLLVPSLALAQNPSPRQGGRPLEGPFRPVPPPEGAAQPCGPVLPPVRSIEGVSFYTDPAASRADPARLEADAASRKPVDEWLASIVGAIARYRVGDPAAAGCALEALDHWARNEALLGAFNQQGGFHRTRSLAGAALAFLAIQGAPGLEPVKLGRVGRWLGLVARAVQPPYDKASSPAAAAAISMTRNNQAAWAGLAVAAAGVAANDRALFNWGMARLRAQLAQVDARGALAQEVARGAMALHYHLFALDALAGLERLGAANGVALSEAERTAYRRLRDLCVASLRDPSVMEAITGVRGSDPPWPAVAGIPLLRAAYGLEIASIAMPDPASDALLAPYRPLSSIWLGGGITGWWRP
jgi:poly(beta-D-mannuronate) lyase